MISGSSNTCKQFALIYTTTIPLFHLQVTNIVITIHKRALFVGQSKPR